MLSVHASDEPARVHRQTLLPTRCIICGLQRQSPCLARSTCLNPCRHIKPRREMSTSTSRIRHSTVSYHSHMHMYGGNCHVACMNGSPSKRRVYALSEAGTAACWSERLETWQGWTGSPETRAVGMGTRFQCR
jgi:hypothetical protein